MTEQNNETKISLSETGIFLGFLVMISVAIALASFGMNVNNTGVVNITVTEKYPIGIDSCGKYGCSYTQPKIVDKNGTLYVVSDENLWARMKIGETYSIRWYTTNMEPQKHINVVKLEDGVWYM
jgi:hypothetical protein